MIGSSTREAEVFPPWYQRRLPSPYCSTKMNTAHIYAAVPRMTATTHRRLNTGPGALGYRHCVLRSGEISNQSKGETEVVHRDGVLTCDVNSARDALLRLYIGSRTASGPGKSNLPGTGGAWVICCGRRYRMGSLVL